MGNSDALYPFQVETITGYDGKFCRLYD